MPTGRACSLAVVAVVAAALALVEGACPGHQVDCEGECCDQAHACPTNAGASCTCCSNSTTCCDPGFLGHGQCVAPKRCCTDPQPGPVLCAPGQTCHSYLNWQLKLEGLCCNGTAVGCGPTCCAGASPMCCVDHTFYPPDYSCCAGQCCGSTGLCCEHATGEVCTNSTDGIDGVECAVPLDIALGLESARAAVIYACAGLMGLTVALMCCGVTCRATPVPSVSGTRSEPREHTHLMRSVGTTTSTTYTYQSVTSTALNALEGRAVPDADMESVLWGIVNGYITTTSLFCALGSVIFGVGATIFASSCAAWQATAMWYTAATLCVMRLLQLASAASVLPPSVTPRASRLHGVSYVMQLLLVVFFIWVTTADSDGDMAARSCEAWWAVAPSWLGVVPVLTMSSVERKPDGRWLADSAYGIGLGGSQTQHNVTTTSSGAFLWSLFVEVAFDGDVVKSVRVSGSTFSHASTTRY